MPALKEPHFLASDMQPAQSLRKSAERRSTRVRWMSIWRCSMTRARAACGRGIGVLSLVTHRGRRIAELQPAARIIATLREPASFLRSLHLMFLRWGVETETDLGKAISLEPSRREGKSVPRQSHRPQLLNYSEHVCYVEQLRSLRRAFAPGAETRADL